MTELDDIVKRHLEWTPEEPQRLPFLILALAGEVGELANLIKKNMRGDSGAEARLQMIRDELADVNAYTRMIGQYFGVDVDELTKKKVLEVEQRPAWKEFIAKQEAKRAAQEK